MKPDDILAGHVYAGESIIGQRPRTRYVWAITPTGIKSSYFSGDVVHLGRASVMALEHMAEWAVADVTEAMR